MHVYPSCNTSLLTQSSALRSLGVEVEEEEKEEEEKEEEEERDWTNGVPVILYRNPAAAAAAAAAAVAAVASRNRLV